MVSVGVFVLGFWIAEPPRGIDIWGEGFLALVGVSPWLFLTSNGVWEDDATLVVHWGMKWTTIDKSAVTGIQYRRTLLTGFRSVLFLVDENNRAVMLPGWEFRGRRRNLSTPSTVEPLL